MHTITINRVIGKNSAALPKLGRLSLSELETVAGGISKFWKGVGKFVAGGLAVAAAVAAVVTAPVSIPLIATAAAAGLGGLELAANGAVEAYDARHTWDDGAETRGGDQTASSYNEYANYRSY